MSPIFMVWFAIISLAILTQTVLVTYGVGFDQNVQFEPAYFVCTVIYMIDIPVRIRTGVTDATKICLEPRQILNYYVNHWLILDVLATVPFEYCTYYWHDELNRYLMLLKVLKLGRCLENLTIIRSNTNQSIFMGFFMFLFVCFGFASHVFTCVFSWVARREDGANTRYDGKTFAWSFEQKLWV